MSEKIDYLCELLNLTRKQVRAICEQCEAIEDHPEGRQWRDGDIIQNGTILRIRVHGKWPCLDGLLDPSGDGGMGLRDDIYFGNLRDLLAQGEILIALKETELVQVVDRSYGTQLMAKLASYLADYRERRRHETPV